MKKYSILFMTVLTGFFVACQGLSEEDTDLLKTTLTASIESQPATKTDLQRGNAGVSGILWAEGDRIGVFFDDATDPAVFTLTSGAGTKKGNFSGYGQGSTRLAVYPADLVTGVEGSSLKVKLPLEQQYKEGSFGRGDFPMIARSTSDNLAFNNILSLLEIPLKGHQTVTRLVFRTNDAQVKVSGPASLSNPSDPLLTMESGSLDSLVLLTNGVLLKEDQASYFYLALPAQTYMKGFTVRIYTTTGYMDKVYASNVTLERSRIHTTTPLQVKLDSGVDSSTSLEGEGTQKSPFLVKSLSDLLLVQAAVNVADGVIQNASGERIPVKGAYYTLTADIDLSPVCSEKLGKSWIPIGNGETPFSGHVDGGGHTVSGLWIDGGSSLDDQALFGSAASGSTFNHLSVEGSVININRNAALLVAQGDGVTVSNCTVSGRLSGSMQVAGIAGYGCKVIQCINRADVSGSYYVAGIVGHTYADILNCINYAPIQGSHDVGGIAGVSGRVAQDCINYGKVTGEGDCVGGVVGNQNADVVINCINYAEVYGSSSVGGIAGYSRQGGYLWNNVNRGKVSGKERVGGVCGWLSSNSSGWGNATTLYNCVNVGVLEMREGGTDIGGVVGYNEGENVQYNYKGSEVHQSYWLYDAAQGIGVEKGIGLDNSISSDLYPLTAAQMKGADAGSVLYGNYTTIVEALNAFAFEKLQYFSTYHLQGWKQDPKDGYPILSGLDAVSPGQDQEVFTVTPVQVSLYAIESSIAVTLTSSLEYTVATPDWIEQVSVSAVPTNPYIKEYVFKAQANRAQHARRDNITFTNTKGKTVTVSVSQAAPKLELDVFELVFPSGAASRRVNITSTVSWVVSSDADWCSAGPASGEGNGVLAVKTQENTSKQARNAQITVRSFDGSILHKISVVQSGAREEGEGDWKTQAFSHQSLFMRFTATWCGWCPRMNKTIQRAQDLYPDRIQHLALHGGGSDLQFSDVGPLMTQYSINAFPTGLVDGRTLISNGEIESTAKTVVATVQETENKYGTLSGVKIGSSLSGRKLDMDIEVFVKKAGDYKLTVLLVEDGILNKQSDYEDGNHDSYVHDNVARMAVTDISGVSFSMSEDLSSKPFSYSATIPSSYVLENLRILVYVQTKFGNNPVIQSGSFGDYYVDNCATVLAGSNLKLALEGGGSGGGEGGDGNEGITPGDDINL